MAQSWRAAAKCYIYFVGLNCVRVVINCWAILMSESELAEVPEQLELLKLCSVPDRWEPCCPSSPCPERKPWLLWLKYSSVQAS